MKHLALLPGLNNTPAVWDDVAEHLEQTAVGPLTIHRPVLAAMASTEALAEDLLRQLPPRFACAGFSFGGYVGLAMMAAAAQRIERFALVCSSTHADSEATRKLRLRSIEIAQAGGHATMMARAHPNTVHPDRATDPTLIARREVMVEGYGAERFIAHSKACMARPDRTELLRAYSGPTLLVAAGQDLLVTPGQVQTIASELPRARFELIDHSGHLLPLEQPRQLADALARWLPWAPA